MLMDHAVAVMTHAPHSPAPPPATPGPRLIDGPPPTRADYVLAQLAQALGGSLLRLSTGGELDTGQLGTVAQALSELAPHGPNRRHNLVRAEFAAYALNAIGPRRDALAPGTGFALAQARSDTAYLVRTAQGGAPPLLPPGRNQNLPFVDALIGFMVRRLDPAQGGHPNPYDTALLNILANLQCIASNAGGMEMPAPIPATLWAVIDAIKTVVQQRGPGLGASLMIGQALGQYVHMLKTITGGGYGVRNSLLSLHTDLGTLAHASCHAGPTR